MVITERIVGDIPIGEALPVLTAAEKAVAAIWGAPQVDYDFRIEVVASGQEQGR
jgi:hypothetical protein